MPTTHKVHIHYLNNHCALCPISLFNAEIFAILKLRAPGEGGGGHRQQGSPQSVGEGTVATKALRRFLIENVPWEANIVLFLSPQSNSLPMNRR